MLRFSQDSPKTKSPLPCHVYCPILFTCTAVLYTTRRVLPSALPRLGDEAGRTWKDFPTLHGPYTTGSTQNLIWSVKSQA
eukprot:jgi/Botrbrau1/2776/Bobra.0164s0053.1